MPAKRWLSRITPYAVSLAQKDLYLAPVMLVFDRDIATREFLNPAEPLPAIRRFSPISIGFLSQAIF
jgi:hypothetical protein